MSGTPTPKQVAERWARLCAAKGAPLYPLRIDRDDEWREAYIVAVKESYVTGAIDLAGFEERLEWAFASAAGRATDAA